MSEHRRAAVFVHGAGGGGWEWGRWARVFAAEGFGVSAPDLVPAPAGLAATSLADYSKQVGGWLDQAAADGARVVAVGASLGGLLALLNAGRADALVLVNPMPPSGLPSGAAVPDIVPWGRRASLAGTRRAVPEADALAALFAFRRWRDESGQVLREARVGRDPVPVRCPVLVMASDQDQDVPPAVSAALAQSLGASLLRLPGSHVAPLLGTQAAAAAGMAVDWLNGLGFVPGVQGALGAPD